MLRLIRLDSFDEIEKRLEFISNKILEVYSNQYESKFISLVNLLIEEFGITNILRGERKLFYVSNLNIKSNPLDLVITFYNEKNLCNKILDEICQELKNRSPSGTNFSITENRIIINFQDEKADYSIIYVPKSEFENLIPYFQLLPDNMDLLNKGIALLKYWNENENYSLHYSHNIEYYIISNKWVKNLYTIIDNFNYDMDYEHLEITEWLIYKSDIIGEEYILVEEEKLLTKLANRLAQESQEKYDSRFISVVNTLQNNMQVSEVRRGGSRAKLTYNIGKGDLDIIFTIVNTTKTHLEIFEETKKTLEANFGKIATITPLRVSVKLHFIDDNLDIDVVYLPYSEYLTSVRDLLKVKETSKIRRDAIRLIKFWNEENNQRRITPMDIEKTILSWNYNSLYNNIVQFGELNGFEMMVYFWLEKQKI